MSGLLTARPGRLLIASALGLAIAVPISTATLSGLPLRSIFAPLHLLTLHPFVAAAAAVVLIAAWVFRRSQVELEALRARALVSLVETNRRFAAAPNESSIRQRLAEAVSDLTGRGAAVSGPHGALAFRAGKAIGWRGAVEAELISLSLSAGQTAGAQIVTLGAFRARTDGLNPRIFGSAIWTAPQGSRTLVREADHYIAVLIELASAAIARQRLASTYPTERLEAVVGGASSAPASAPIATSGRLITMGRFPAA